MLIADAVRIELQINGVNGTQFILILVFSE